MLKWNPLHQSLEKTANRHLQLYSRFDAFAKFVQVQVTHHDFHIKNIGVSLQLEKNFFTTTFAGRTLYFVFSSTVGDGGLMVGNVKCLVEISFPEKTYSEIGEFTFTGNAQTNLIEPEDNDPITIDTDLSSLYVALHFINESLSK